MKRRSFLGMMAASPMAAKQVAQEASMKLAGINIGGMGNDENINYGLAGSTNVEVAMDQGPKMAERSVIAKLLGQSVPEFKLDELKRHSRNPRTIGANTASLKSVSLVSKINIQAKRDFEKAVDTFKGNFDDNPFDKQREAFFKQTGWWL